MRDIDILADMAAMRIASVASRSRRSTASSRGRWSRARPRRSAARSHANLSEAGIPVCVLASPMIPALNDNELDASSKPARRMAPTPPARFYCACPGTRALVRGMAGAAFPRQGEACPVAGASVARRQNIFFRMGKRMTAPDPTPICCGYASKKPAAASA